MKKYIIIAFALVLSITAQGQDAYKKYFPQGQLILNNVNGVEIETYNGKEIIITTDIDNKNTCHNHHCNTCRNNHKTKGLKRISGTEEMDNTGLGLRIDEIRDGLEVTQVTNAFNSVNAHIQVPKKVKIQYKNSNVSADDFIVKNVSTELEVTQTHGDVILNNVTGPMAIQCIYGDVTAVFSELNRSGSVSINATYGDADISLPSNSKANLLMKTGYGEAYTDFEIKVDRNITKKDRRRLIPVPPTPPTPPISSKSVSSHSDSDGSHSVISYTENGVTTTIIDGVVQEAVDEAMKSTAEVLKMFGNNQGFGSYIKGSINGGGVDVIIRCSYGDIYLRQK